jgi:hypothetical protein
MGSSTIFLRRNSDRRVDRSLSGMADVSTGKKEWTARQMRVEVARSPQAAIIGVDS